MPAIHIPGTTGFGLMNFTWTPNPRPFEDAFKIMLESIKQGAVFWNGGEFYGFPPNIHLNLELLRAFFEKYPEQRSKVTISVKGALGANLVPDCSAENIKKSIETTISYLPNNHVDLFEPARLDGKHQIEDIVKSMVPFVESGKIGGISLSEVNADTIRRAAKAYTISAVEVEFSLLTQDPRHNGVLKACAENNITLVAYSPLGRGFLTGTLKSTSDIPKGDIRLHMDRYSDEEVFQYNLQLVEKLKPVAEKKGVTLAQLSLAWIRYFSGKPGYPKVIPIPSAASSVNRLIENVTDIELTDAEFEEVEKIVGDFEVRGLRYNKMAEKFLSL